MPDKPSEWAMRSLERAQADARAEWRRLHGARPHLGAPAFWSLEEKCVALALDEARRDGRREGWAECREAAENAVIETMIDPEERRVLRQEISSLTQPDSHEER